MISIAGGPALRCIEAEARTAREFDDLVHTPTAELRVEVTSSDYKPAYPNDQMEYLGNLATVTGEGEASDTWRVAAISVGRHATTIDLVSKEEGAA